MVQSRRVEKVLARMYLYNHQKGAILAVTNRPLRNKYYGTAGKRYT
jgi:hypothetical protein